MWICWTFCFSTRSGSYNPLACIGSYCPRSDALRPSRCKEPGIRPLIASLRFWINTKVRPPCPSGCLGSEKLKPGLIAVLLIQSHQGKLDQSVVDLVLFRLGRQGVSHWEDVGIMQKCNQTSFRNSSDNLNCYHIRPFKIASRWTYARDHCVFVRAAR